MTVCFHFPLNEITQSIKDRSVNSVKRVSNTYPFIQLVCSADNLFIQLVRST